VEPTEQTTNWKEAYRRILAFGIAGPEDFPAAVQLIDEGYASGSYAKNRIGNVSIVERVTWGRPTVKGNLLADALNNEFKAARRRCVTSKIMIAVASAVLGFGLAAGLYRGAL